MVYVQDYSCIYKTFHSSPKCTVCDVRAVPSGGQNRIFDFSCILSIALLVRGYCIYQSLVILLYMIIYNYLVLESQDDVDSGVIRPRGRSSIESTGSGDEDFDSG